MLPNAKHWVTREVKTAVNHKKRAFLSGDRDMIKHAHTELKAKMKQAKLKYN